MAYGKTNLEAINDDLKKSSGDSRFFTVGEKGSKVFFCPPSNEKLRFPYQEILIHYNVAQEKILCLKQFGQPCPVCEANSELFNMKNDMVAQQLSKDIYAKKNYLYSVIPDIDVKMTSPSQGVIYYAGKEEPKVKLYLIGKKLHKLIGDFLGMNGDIFDPLSGNMILLSKMLNSGKDPKFAQTFASPHPAKCQLDPVLMNLMNNLPDLTKVYEPMPYANVKNYIDLKLAQFRASKTGGQVPQYQQQPVQAVQYSNPNINPNVTVTNVPSGNMFNVHAQNPIPQNVTIPKAAGTIENLDEWEKGLVKGNQ